MATQAEKDAAVAKLNSVEKNVIQEQDPNYHSVLTFKPSDKVSETEIKLALSTLGVPSFQHEGDNVVKVKKSTNFAALDSLGVELPASSQLQQEHGWQRNVGP